jgi:DNA primase large subunit
LFASEYLAVLDPFAEEAKKIVEASPPVDAMPQEIIERATNRVKWSNRDMVVEPDSESIRAEVLSFYLMCQGVASVSYPYSREVRMISDSTRNTIRYRMYDLFKRGQEELCMKAVRRSINLVELEGENWAKLGEVEIPREDFYKLRDQELEKDGIDVVDDRVLHQYLPRYAVRWVDLAPLLRHRRVELTKLYLLKGWAVLTLQDLWNFYANFISVRTEDYIQSVYERISESGMPSKLLAEVGERISSLLPKEPEFMERFARLPSRRLRPEFFPPCVNRALGGTSAGLRNYAITMMLTPFLSYARISPSGRVATRMADFTDDISVIRDEIAPLIFEAAEHCSPPLFKDQPQEKASIFYHMGFGMTTEPRLGDSGKSKWYRMPNCTKIQMSAAPLCNPDEFCRKIKNPLTYYFRKMSEHMKAGTGE